MSLARTMLVVAALAVSGPPAVADGETGSVQLARMLDQPPGARMVLSKDPVTASFQRMLNHEPNRVAPPIPASFERDPLIEALVLPLLRWSASTRRPAVAGR